MTKRKPIRFSPVEDGSSVNVRLWNVDHAHLKTIQEHLAQNPDHYGPQTLSSTIRWALWYAHSVLLNIPKV